MAKVKLALKDLTIPQKIQFIRQVVTAMTGNANFTTPAPALAAITALVNALEAAFNVAQAAYLTAKQKTDLQTAAEQQMDAAITQLAAYVENITAGDAGKILSGGMETRADAVPIGALPAPQNLSATAGDQDGDIDLDWDNIRGAKSYRMEKSSDPITATSWQLVEVVTKSKGTVSGLTSGTKYWFRVAAIGTAGQSPWSDPATKIAP